MTVREQDDGYRAAKSRDMDFIGALAALRRSAIKARRRAFETTGSVAIVKDGKVVWETAEGTFLDEPERYTESRGNPSRNLGEIPRDIGESP